MVNIHWIALTNCLTESQSCLLRLWVRRTQCRTMLLYAGTTVINVCVTDNMQGVIFVRPSHENLKLLENELMHPKYKRYFICELLLRRWVAVLTASTVLSNTINQEYLQKIAEADVHSRVAQVHEYFADFYPVNRHLFNLNIGNR